MKRERFSISELAGIPCEKPGRYTGGEVNSIKPSADAELKVCLLFPDLYELGVSYYGFQILYHLFNQIPGVACERSYLPWEDMQLFLRRGKRRLYSLESGRFLNTFDVIGITLQTELHYPGVVKALDLAGIPRYAADRRLDDPLVIGGGPCAFHPEPVALFFDAFVVGDGEEVVPELAALLMDRDFRRADRREKWQRLACVEGMYAPAFYSQPGDPRRRLQTESGAHPTIRARVTPRLKRVYYPDRPYVPNIAAAHDRLTVEIMRGCSQGCRFCQAGMINRPVRERNPLEVIEQVLTGLDSTGWNEVGLLSLSTSDYGGCRFLFPKLVEALSERRATVSFPSMRPGSFTEEMASLDTGGRKVSLTFAVEAGSERLRSVINKSLCEEELFEAVARAFRHGWRGVKLYFMVGLPTERDSDVAEGADLLFRLRRQIPRGKSLHVSVSSFIPKPFSVFEREAYVEVELLLKRQMRLIADLRGRGVDAAWRDPQESLVEAALCRGDRRMARVIEEVAEAGSGFEAWDSEFSRNRWFEALERNLPDWQSSVGKLKDNHILPWDHISKGLTPRFREIEIARAEAAERTPDCREDCAQCGLMNICDYFQSSRVSDRLADEISLKSCDVQPNEGGGKIDSGVWTPAAAVEPRWRYRLEFTKLRRMRYLGHLDVMRAVECGLQRAGAPLAHSRGFNPRPQVSFGPALPLGVGARKTWIEFQTTCEMDPDEWRSRLQKELPKGLRPLALKPAIHKKGESEPEGGDRERCYRIKLTAPLTTGIIDESDMESDRPSWLRGFEVNRTGNIVYATICRDGAHFPKPAEILDFFSNRRDRIPSKEDAGGPASVTLI